MAAVAAATNERVWTDAELEALPRDGHKRELLDGEIIISPVHANHGTICIQMAILLGTFVQEHKPGGVYDSSTARAWPG